MERSYRDGNARIFYLSHEKPVCSQEATVRILYGTDDQFRIEKGVQQGCLLLTCLFNLYTKHIMRNPRLGELQAGIKTGRRNINNLRYADDTTLKVAESQEE